MSIFWCNFHKNVIFEYLWIFMKTSKIAEKGPKTNENYWIDQLFNGYYDSKFSLYWLKNIFKHFWIKLQSFGFNVSSMRYNNLVSIATMVTTLNFSSFQEFSIYLLIYMMEASNKFYIRGKTYAYLLMNFHWNV